MSLLNDSLSNIMRDQVFWFIDKKTRRTDGSSDVHPSPAALVHPPPSHVAVPSRTIPLCLCHTGISGIEPNFPVSAIKVCEMLKPQWAKSALVFVCKQEGAR